MQSSLFDDEKIFAVTIRIESTGLGYLHGVTIAPHVVSESTRFACVEKLQDLRITSEDDGSGDRIG